MFQINGFLKFIEEDNWKEGCNPDTSTSQSVDLRFTGKTADEVIQKAAEYLGVKEDGIERNACDEKGRVDFALTEDENGSTLSKSQWAKFKKGRIRAWYAVYSAYVEKVTPAKL